MTFSSMSIACKPQNRTHEESATNDNHAVLVSKSLPLRLATMV